MCKVSHFEPFHFYLDYSSYLRFELMSVGTTVFAVFWALNGPSELEVEDCPTVSNCMYQ